MIFGFIFVHLPAVTLIKKSKNEHVLVFPLQLS